MTPPSIGARALAAFVLLVAACSGAAVSSETPTAASVGQRTPGATEDPATTAPTPSSTATPAAPTEGATTADEAARLSPTAPAESSPTPAASPQPVPDSDRAVEATPTEPAALAAEIEPLPAAPVGLPDVVEAAQPIGLRIPSIGVGDASVIAAGVDAAGDFDVPPAEEVGWYEFGPRPGDNGSAVLAAHIAFDGVDGVFRYLNDAQPGDVVFVDFSDGTTREFEIADVESYNKEDLPTDSLFNRDGPPRLALITCGGAFNYAESSYEDNVVAIAFERVPEGA